MFVRLLATVFLCLGLIGATVAPAGAQNQRLQVVATFSILGDLVRNVGGNAIDLRVLVGPNGDAHVFTPTAADARALAQSDLIFENGLNFETWLDRVYAASRSSAWRAEVTTGLPVLLASDDAHRHGEYDPHLWHDVSAVASMTYRIRDWLVWADPANARQYEANAAAYVGSLQALDAWIFDYVAWLRPDQRQIVTPHSTFAYFARRYDFRVPGTALGSISTEAAPSARRLADLAQTIRVTGVPVIFPDNVSSPRLMQQVAAEAGVTLGPPLYTDALGGRGTPGETYLGMMYYNVMTIVDWLYG